MSDLKISDMLDYQRRLYDQHRDDWSPHTPQYARDSLLWSIDEIGEGGRQSLFCRSSCQSV